MAIKYNTDSRNEETELFKLFKEKIVVIIVNAGVSLLPDKAFEEFTSLKKVIFPDSIRQLGRGLFFNCPALKTIKIPPRISIIPVDCFFNCKELESVYFGTSVVEIKNGAFAGADKVKLITPKHRITIPKKDKEWYLAHLERTEVQESLDTLDEAYSDKIPDWMMEFIKDSRKPWNGYNGRTDFKNYLLNTKGVDLSNVKFKKAKTPKTKDDLKALLNEKDNKMYFFYIPNDRELFRSLQDGRNWSTTDNDIIYVPDDNSCSIGYYAPDNLDRLSATKLLKLLSTSKVAYLDRNDKNNFRKEKQDIRQASRQGIPNPRRREQGQVIQQNFIVRKKDDIPDAFKSDWYDWPDKEIFDSKREADNWYKASYGFSHAGHYESSVPRRTIYNRPEPYGEPTIKNPYKGWRNVPDYDLSGYNIADIKRQLKHRLNEYKKGNLTQILDRLQKQMEDIKSKISPLFKSAIDDGSSSAMSEFDKIFRRFTAVVTDYNELISNLDFILMVDDETERKQLLDKIFSLDSWSKGKFKHTIHEVIDEINELSKSLKDFETDFVESLKK